MEKYTYKIGHYSNENAIALTVTCLNEEYPNVAFEAVDDGCGRYELFVSSTHGAIYYNQLVVFKNVTTVLYKAIPTIEKALKEFKC